MEFGTRSICFAIGLLLTSCTIHHVCECPAPEVTIPDAFSVGGIPSSGAVELSADGAWWRQYGDDNLNALVSAALANNLNVSQAWQRLSQAQASVSMARSSRWPVIETNASLSHVDVKDSGSSVPFTFNASITRYLLTPSLTYEFDLWKKINSKVLAAEQGSAEACEEARATELVLSRTVMELWLTIQEQRELETVLKEQIDVSRTLLDLVELRFSLGNASALDVYQQRQQLKSIELELPAVKSTLEQAKQQLNVVLGQAPTAPIDFLGEGWLPLLPPMPVLGSPSQLLVTRPDLRAAHASLVAADYELAAAIADRFPRLDITLSYEMSTTDFSQLFERQVGTFFGNLFMPLFDAARRQCEAERRRAIVCERVDAFAAAFLTALSEVEGALTREHYQKELLTKLEEQISISRANLTEARSRYANGLSDYLTVIAAVQALQGVERRLITEKKALLAERATLYQALGGWVPNHSICHDEDYQ